MTATYPVLEIEKSAPAVLTSEAPVLTVVADGGQAKPAVENQPEPRDWDPYHVWKRLIRKDPDQT